MSHAGLIHYFDRELAYLRKAGAEFARRYPRIARNLELSATGSADPHVERLLEGFAFLTARIHRKLDDDLSHITSALLEVVAPHYLAPFPSVALLQLSPDVTEGRHTECQKLARGTLLRSRPVKGNPCLFRTCFPLEIWPLMVSQARLGSPIDALAPPARARTAIGIELRCLQNIRLQELALERLRFYIHGPDRKAFAIHDFLHTAITRVDVVDPESGTVLAVLPPESLRPCGFESDESLLLETSPLQHGNQLLLEFFAFPNKFRFFEVSGLRGVAQQARGQRLEFVFYAEKPAPSELEGLDASCFQLGCTPVINSFRRPIEPINVKQTEHTYALVPDRHRQRTLEIAHIASVKGVVRGAPEPIEYRPFYSLAHQTQRDGGEQAYWFAVRTPSDQEGDPGTEVSISFVTLGFEEAIPQVQSVLIDAYLTNRDLPSQLPIHEGQTGDFHLDQGSSGTVRCLVKPTPTLRLPLGRGQQWRLISTLALNHSSLTDPEHGLSQLQEVLRLHDFRASQASEQQIRGIVSLTSRPVAARVRVAGGADGVARGFELTLELDPARFVGSSPLIFAAVLERYLASRVGMNAFTKLSVKLQAQEGYLQQWAPRAGERPLI